MFTCPAERNVSDSEQVTKLEIRYVACLLCDTRIQKVAWNLSTRTKKGKVRKISFLGPKTRKEENWRGVKKWKWQIHVAHMRAPGLQWGVTLVWALWKAVCWPHVTKYGAPQSQWEMDETETLAEASIEMKTTKTAGKPRSAQLSEISQSWSVLRERQSLACKPSYHRDTGRWVASCSLPGLLNEFRGIMRRTCHGRKWKEGYRCDSVGGYMQGPGINPSSTVMGKLINSLI